ncbi:MAG: molecular chaperone HtpG [Acholeplasmatales bacterium]|nr:MAG: molecular chaperone HtpG [Acholeplasmatales bacterium]
MAKTKSFKTESKKLLQLMINSIYTHKDIFLRELISNASDAIDKRHFLSLTDASVPSEAAYEIRLYNDMENRTLTIEDNGIGMTEEELVHNLGTIAESGSKAFLEKLEQKDVEIIGQFGVGFYSAFMVAKEVEILTRSPYAETGYRWVSKGESTYKIEPVDKTTIGTEIRLQLRDNDPENEAAYDTYLETHTLRRLVKKYSDYIRYPIMIEVTEKKDEETVTRWDTLNSQVPIWKKPKKELTEEALNSFYKRQYNDFEDPLLTIHTNVEGLLTYTALLFIPAKPAHDFYTENYEKGLQLYSKGVFIEDRNKALIPDYFRFVRGLVDSADLTLNISREMLQHDRQLKKIANHLEKKVKSELEKLLKNDRERYVKFYETYGVNLKYGVYSDFGANTELLQDLILFKTSKSDDYITLAEYLDRKTDAQKSIYYATGRSKAQIMSLPQMDALKEKDYEVLLFTEDVDEFMIQVMPTYRDVPFKSIQAGASDLLDEAKKSAIEENEKTHKDLLETLKTLLKDDLQDVRLSGRLKESPVCLVSGEGLSLEMERVLKKMPDAPDTLKAERILEINPDHPLFQALTTVHTQQPDRLEDYARLLYHQALLIEGITPENPVAFAELMAKLMVEAAPK